MIVILKNGAAEEKKNQLIDWLKEQGLQIHTSVGEYQTVLGLVGDTSRVDMDLIASLGIVDSVKRVTEPFKCCNRKFHPDDTVVQVGDVRIGGGNFVMIAGPCSVESEEQIVGIAKAVKASGAQILRGGAFKPRTSPYDFQGLAATGLELLKIARQETGLPIVTEIMGTSALDLFADVDVIQVGARNMQNFDLLKELGKLRKPILLKRGLAATLKELLMSAEYIMAGGNEQIILCERGIRTFLPVLPAWCARWRALRRPAARTASSSKSTTTRCTRCATAHSPSSPRSTTRSAGTCGLSARWQCDDSGDRRPRTDRRLARQGLPRARRARSCL